jgi:hypothetical protein
MTWLTSEIKGQEFPTIFLSLVSFYWILYLKNNESKHRYCGHLTLQKHFLAEAEKE